MRWSIIRLIWVRELRDQLRDRRTVLMIVVLPLLLYPALGVGVLQMAQGFLNQQSAVGIYDMESLVATPPRRIPPSVLPATAWLAALPAPGGCHAWVTGACLSVSDRQALEYPPLVESPQPGQSVHFLPGYFEVPADAATMSIKDLGPLDATEWPRVLESGPAAASADFLEPLKRKQVDALVIVTPHFRERLERGERPSIWVLGLEGDDRSRLVAGKVMGVLGRWKKQLKDVRLLRRGLSPDFDDVIELRDPEHDKPATAAAESLIDMMGRLFPFLLVMWFLAGALYPAVDLCAGEKERGTMETLLISPVSREEIVYGKFLAIWVFSAATAFLNLVSMAVTTWRFSSDLHHQVLKPEALLWCVVLLLPLSAFFSALCLAVGAYARSSKEGQYYLMPLFLLTMPLVFLTFAPGVELSPFYSLVPVTGVALLLRELMTASNNPTTWLYFLPVLAPMVLYGWLALRWAVMQFQREEVLFREAERLDLGLWLRRLFREKEPLPSAGQGLFCVALILLLRWLSFGFGDGLPLMVTTGISYLAFVLVPTVFMALLLTTRPLASLGLRAPSLKALLLGAALALLLLVPLAELTGWVLDQFPGMRDLVREGNPLTRELESVSGGEYEPRFWVQYLLVLGLLAPVCEEIVFRGFLLGALLRRFRPWAAILLTAFLFALFHGNVFQFAPAFVMGAVLALLAVRTGSVWPGIVLHAVFNSLLPSVAWLERQEVVSRDQPGGSVIAMLVAALSTLAAGVLVWRLWASRGGLRRLQAEIELEVGSGSLPNGKTEAKSLSAIPQSERET